MTRAHEILIKDQKLRVQEASVKISDDLKERLASAHTAIRDALSKLKIAEKRDYVVYFTFKGDTADVYVQFNRKAMVTVAEPLKRLQPLSSDKLKTPAGVTVHVAKPPAGAIPLAAITA